MKNVVEAMNVIGKKANVIGLTNSRDHNAIAKINSLTWLLDNLEQCIVVNLIEITRGDAPLLQAMFIKDRTQYLLILFTVSDPIPKSVIQIVQRVACHASQVEASYQKLNNYSIEGAMGVQE